MSCSKCGADNWGSPYLCYPCFRVFQYWVVHHGKRFDDMPQFAVRVDEWLAEVAS